MLLCFALVYFLRQLLFFDPAMIGPGSCAAGLVSALCCGAAAVYFLLLQAAM